MRRRGDWFAGVIAVRGRRFCGRVVVGTMPEVLESEPNDAVEKLAGR